MTDTDHPSDQMPSIWPGLWETNNRGPYIVGSCCKHCRTVTVGAAGICASCWSAAGYEIMEIGRRGTVYTYTQLHQAPSGFRTPMTVGYVDLQEGPRIFAHLDPSEAPIEIGQSVELSVSLLRSDADGTREYGPLFVPAQEQP